MNKFSLLIQLSCITSLATASLMSSDEQHKAKNTLAAVKAVANTNQKNTQTATQNQLPQQPVYYCNDCGYAPIDANYYNPSHPNPDCPNRYCC